MKLVAPVNRPEEVEPLVKSGADELYCGIVPSEWIERFGPMAPLNRRDPGPANLSMWDEFAAVMDQARRFGVTVQLVLNAPAYSDAQISVARGFAERLVDEFGVDAVIVADVALLMVLKRSRPELRVHVSSLAAVRNTEAVRFFRELGATRVILPRHILVQEAVRMATAVRDIEIEVFILNDGCIYEEGLCRTSHSAGPLCLTDWQYTFRSVDGADPRPNSETEAARRNAEDYRRWIACQVAQAGLVTPTGMPAGPCGLCAIPELARGGVHSVKVVGREAPFYKKLRSVQQVRAVLDRAAGGFSAEACALARRIRGTPELCGSGYGCYYPESTRRSSR